MSDEEASAAAIETPVAVVSVRGEEVEITPLKVRDWPAFVRLAKPIGLVERVGVSVNWMQLITEHGEAVIACIALLVDRPRGWVESLYADDLIKLAGATMEVNTHFFVRGVMPALAEQMPRMRSLIGLSSSKPSSLTDTDETTS